MKWVCEFLIHQKSCSKLFYAFLLRKKESSNAFLLEGGIEKQAFACLPPVLGFVCQGPVMFWVWAFGVTQKRVFLKNRRINA